MATAEQTKNAKDFSEYWKDKGAEKQEAQRYWIGLLQEVLGIENPSRYIEFEKPVKLSHASFIDGFINSTKVLIEQKGSKVDLTKAYPQSDGAILTPYQQAKRYADELPYDLRPRWIVVSNFKEIHIHDMNNPHTEPEIVKLGNLEKEYYRLQFLVDIKNEKIRREEEISLQAGILVGKLYDALIKEYIDPDEESLRSLNILCVRLVFCLYAEDAGFFESRTCFEDYIKSFNLPDLREGLIKLFKGLDTKLENRDKYDLKLKPFPYVNGGLFAAEDIEIPNFTQEIVDVLVKDCAPFDWREISPTIFGAVFESTLNPETRRTGGMHYTSIENIHKVIDPLFMDELEAEFEKICATTNAKSKSDKLHAFQEKLGNLKFLDPACGSGNFLTETYLSIRRLENKVISVLNNGEKLLGFDEFIKVKINQFYGIEINDFAVTVAKTALWIAESQMMTETEKIIGMNLDFLPLTTNAFIVEGNALRMNWATLKPIDENVQLNDGLFAGFATEVDGNEIQYDYIMGNPPFVGQAFRTKEQAKEMQDVFAPSPAGGKLDYVAGWFKKATDFMENTKVKCAFVSSNSICQGESVSLLWSLLFEKGIIINFCHSTFKWESESTDKAHVHVVVIGFSYENNSNKNIFENGEAKNVTHINGYLKPAPNVFIQNRSKSINAGMATVVQGSPPADDGKLLLSKDEKESFLAKYPELENVINPFVGSREFINDTEFTRFCFWFANESPAKFKHIKELIERFNYVRDYRMKSPVDRIQKTADKPFLFTQNRQPTTQYLLIPRVSSEKRKYIPIGFLSPEVIASDACVLVYDATLVEFGLICSFAHNAWMRTIAGRLEMRYRYAPSVFYNFPFPQLTDEDKKAISASAQKILDARTLYKEHSLADMYGEEMYLFPELLKAHNENDALINKLYGLSAKATETEIVGRLMELYLEKTGGK
ncbi:MAG: DNA methyltransferase [Treponemataceae bacterium]|nr:DNA methyltransferase [Treponemataceae bacterium]